MKLLHTSDWHLGQNFMGKSRAEEHSVFLQWLTRTIKERQIELLIVSGDIFDTGTPPNYALELYYNFLKSLMDTACRNIIITGGNHDSVATLKVSREILRLLDIHVIASGGEDDETLIEIEEDGELEAIVCAVPFLRDATVRKSIGGESISEREKALEEGIRRYYEDLYEKASKIRGDRDIPIIATGHLTTVGSVSSDSEREIYIGGTMNISGAFFAESFDYVALGHLHKNQRAGCDSVRYSGSPIALSFAEASATKRVNLVSFEGRKPLVEELEIPVFRRLLTIRGDKRSVLEELASVEDMESWIEVRLEDENPLAATQEIRSVAERKGLSLLAVKTERFDRPLSMEEGGIADLDDLKPDEVFAKRLEMDEMIDEELTRKLSERFARLWHEAETV